jgi:hypothetical protein
MYNKALSISETCNTISSDEKMLSPHGITALVINAVLAIAGPV